MSKGPDKQFPSVRALWPGYQELGMKVELAAAKKGDLDKLTGAECEERAGQGLCKTNPVSMLASCRASCGFCSKDSLMTNPSDWAPGSEAAKALLSAASSPSLPCYDRLDACSYIATRLGHPARPPGPAKQGCLPWLIHEAIHP